MDANAIFSLLLLCSVTELCVLASPEGNDSQQQHYPQNVYHDIGLTRNTIVTAQFECYQKIMKNDKHNKIGRGMAGCAGRTQRQASLQTSTVQTTSKTLTQQKWRPKCAVKRVIGFYTQRATGHGQTTPNVQHTPAQEEWSLSCQRITLHKNLFFSFVLNSVITIIWLTAVANNQGLVQSNPVSCKVIMFIHLYLFGCNYFWMLCEGIYLHTLIVVAVFAEKQLLMWYYLLGWGFPLIPALIHAIARSYYYNDNCWISSNTSLLYIIHGPICAALLVTHQAESSLYMKAVRATLILVPLLGIQFVLFPYKPQGRVALEIYDYIMNILMHYQGLLVATIFCFFNGEVQGVLRRHWNQQRIQFGSNFAHADVFRSASYVASSLTEVHRCYSIDGHTEHMNGKNSYHDIETVTPIILRSENLFA
ncbi:unnamed protein product [Coregonus sp. 'balchen']|nr:unnamed protein product [Coregonus sp. 'balchen']